MMKPPNEPFRRHGQPADTGRPPDLDGGHRYRRGKDEREISEDHLQRRVSQEAAERETLFRFIEERTARGAEITRRRRRDARWTREACLTGLRAFYGREGRSPTGADVTRSKELPSVSTIAHLFGNFNAALVAAELPLNHVTQGHPKWSDDEILAAIRRAEQEGERTSEPFRDGHRAPWLGTIERRFGSWGVAKALAHAGPRETARS